MDVLLREVKSTEFNTLLHLAFGIFATGICRRYLKSSATFVKRPYNTESLLSDVLNAKYKALLDSDSVVALYSYKPLKYFQYVVIATRPGDRRAVVVCGSIMVWMAHIAHSGLDLAISYFDGDYSSPIAAVALIITIISVYLGITMMSSLKEYDAGCVTVYFNATEKNWVTTSDIALFDSSESMEIPIKWSVEMLVQAVMGLCSWGRALSDLAPMIEVYRTKAMPDIAMILGSILNAIYCYWHVANLGQVIRARRRAVPTIEVQLAQADSDKDVDNADILNFDVGKIIRKFANDVANDVAKEFANSGKNWMADSGVYYDFAITGEHGGLVYGRMRAGGGSVSA
ncbi:hypothetical protein V1520DRAFT_350380 [Lipomyces starkeyi]|uniref:Uncharacterized protein n=1 Tax=Lipomyces starkeyi NRRL Y-11557 TaxID=675824 RepID=A0A1E3Q2U2_LIPST|nr:hypothetical protein LIPSTDRAFT_73175 [Lipomyces starkeyi NRRL Y-11557]